MQKDIIDKLATRPFSLRKITAEDAPLLAEFHTHLSERSKELFTPHLFDLKSLQVVCERFAEEIYDSGFLVCAEDGRIAAYFFLWHINEDVPELGISVVDEYQGHGLGRLCMEYMIAEGKKLGKKQLRLTTGLDNDNAFHLYEKCGFVYKGIIEIPNGPGGKPFLQREMFYSYDN